MSRLDNHYQAQYNYLAALKKKIEKEPWPSDDTLGAEAFMSQIKNELLLNIQREMDKVNCHQKTLFWRRKAQEKSL